MKAVTVTSTARQSSAVHIVLCTPSIVRHHLQCKTICAQMMDDICPLHPGSACTLHSDMPLPQCHQEPT